MPFWNALQHLQRADGIAFIVVKVSEVSHGLFGIRVQLNRSLEFLLCFFNLVADAIEASEQEVVFHARRIDAHDLLVLFDGLLQHVLRLNALLHVAERTQVDATQQAACVEVLRIAPDDLFSFKHGIANAPGLGVEFSDLRIQIRIRRIVFDRELVLLDRAIHVFQAPGGRHHVFIHVGQREVVIGFSAIGLGGRCGRLFTRRRRFLRIRRLRLRRFHHARVWRRWLRRVRVFEILRVAEGSRRENKCSNSDR